MPTYSFKCRSCGEEYEELVLRMGDLADCPKCGSKDVELQISAPAVGRGSSGSARCDSAPPNCGFS